MLTIERYIISEVRRPVTMMVGFLTFVFASYSAERYLTEAANGTLALGVVLDIVFYKVLIALEMLLPVGLYASVAIALGRLYNDSEITAILASGASPLRIYRAILIIATPLALAVAALSFYGRPGPIRKPINWNSNRAPTSTSVTCRPNASTSTMTTAG